jgi:DNA-binding response OmpR family regulator
METQQTNTKTYTEAIQLQQPLILVIEDDEIFAKGLSLQLESNGFSCEISVSPRAGLDRVCNGPKPSLILLDYFLGRNQSNGLELCEQIKSSHDIPLIMLTANDEVDVMVNCLDAGADQYIVKPCQTRELIARIRSVLRMYQRKRSTDNKLWDVDIDGIKVSTKSFSINLDGAVIQLTEKETIAASLLADSLGENCSRESLYLGIYGNAYNPMNRSVDMLITRLRKKITEINKEVAILPVRNIGYRMTRTANIVDSETSTNDI